MQDLSKEDLERLKDKYGDIKIVGGVNAHIKKIMANKPIGIKTMKEIKKELNIKDADIASMFGYANAHSYRTSKARAKFDRGLEIFYNLSVTR